EVIGVRADMKRAVRKVRIWLRRSLVSAWVYVSRVFRPAHRFVMKTASSLRSRYHALAHLHPFMRTLWFRTILHLSVILLIISPLYAVLDFVLKDISYRMSDKESALVSASTVDSDFIKQSDTAITYNRADEAAGNKDLQTVLTMAANKEDATGKKPYQAELSKDAKDGITFSDSEGDRRVSLTPTFTTGQGRLQDDRVIYPTSTTEKHIYSFKNNGIKSDILLTQAPGSDTKTYSWDLGLDSTLEARMLPDGGVGIYSADPTLYGDLQISDQKSQELVDKARKNAKKNTLVFELPKPFILDANNKQVYAGVSYSLTGDDQTLTLTANNLKQQAYPLSIDPTITITTTSDFRQKTGDTGNVDFGTDGEIRRGATGNGTVGTWNTTTSIATGRSGHTSVAYNGYLYVMGGLNDADVSLDDVRYAPLNANGTVGPWSATTSLPMGRSFHASVAYSGYMYSIGGSDGYGQNSDVEYAPINADGTIGAWEQAGYFNTAREAHTSVAYNGYLYVIGGSNGTALNDVQYAPINANGTIGSWTATTSFTTARSAHASVAYNGYLYVIGGSNGTALNDVQYAPINANGTIGAWTPATSFATARFDHSSVAYNGYLYVVAGYNTGGLTDVQYAPLNTNETGATQTDTSSYFANPRYQHASVAYNGYLYITGGWNGTNYYNDVQYAAINPDGTLGTFTTSPNAFLYARYFHTSVAYNGYLYVIGGTQSVSSTTCKNTGTAIECNDVQYAPINADGSIGSFTTNTNYFTNRRAGHASVAYNGYLYVIGGAASVYYGDIQYATINANGSLSTFTTSTNSFTGVRMSPASIVYNGYLYVVGGIKDVSDTGCKNTGIAQIRCNDVQYAPINSDGSLGTFITNSTYFAVPRATFIVASGGYMFVVGGRQNNTDTACVNTGVADARCNDVQRAAINADGSVGSFATQTESYFSLPRGGHYVVDYNGVAYITGGLKTASDTACKNTGVASTSCNDTQYVRISPSGGIESSFTTDASSYFSVPRQYHTSVAYNGFLYIIGGQQAANDMACKDSGTSTYCNDVQYATINADGTLGAWLTDYAYFSFPRSGHTSVAYNGYLYVIGGNSASSGTDCKNTGIGSSVCNDVQYASMIDDGMLDGWTTDTSSYFNIPRSGHTTIAYNGYMYIIGGVQAASASTCKDGPTNTYCNDVQYAPINADGSLGVWTTDTSSYFNKPRRFHSMAAANGFLYILGGTNATYLSDLQYTSINADGSLGSWSAITSNTFATPRYGHTSAMVKGRLYVMGGYQANSNTDCKDTGTSNYCNDTQLALLTGVQYKARYERIFDTGSGGSSLVGLTINGATMCDYTVTYRRAGSDGIFNWNATLYGLKPGVLRTLYGVNARYLQVAVLLDDSACGTQSTVTSIALTYNSIPEAPTLVAPTSGALSVDILPEFRLGTTDDPEDYLRYKIQVCADSSCTSVVRTIDQTISQAGWASQSQQGATAYSGGALTQLAIHKYQPTALAANTQYWWRAQAIDPAGTGTWSAHSQIASFTTVAASADNDIYIGGGGVTIYGGTGIKTGN
ncbi:hypothetical protein B7Z17_00150, partial [Candidatus Saccharibacteria bacterium 32-49-10]